MKFYLTICFIIIFIINIKGQNTHINLDQGAIVGLKVFPESSKTPIFAFLGIPYALPPIGNLRFAQARPHTGWKNSTILVNNFKPLCPQIKNSIYDENPKRTINNNNYQMMNEDCLYLNIWTPEAGLRYGNLPVVIIITGEEMSFDWTQNRPSGLDLASEGVVVITIQYRMNIFGWIGINTYEFPGNLAISDQLLAFKWIENNIHKFGGNSKQITLLGHGSTGFIMSLIHLFSPNSIKYFSKLILMSGSTKLYELSDEQNLSYELIEKLGCKEETSNHILKCLRTKSVTDLLRSFEYIYKNGNYTKLLGPILDYFQSEPKQYIPKTIEDILKNGEFNKIPIMIGICTNEGSFIHDYWIDLAREGYDQLYKYINNTILPLILEKYKINDSYQVLKTIKWKYFQMDNRNPSYLLNSMQRLISEAIFEAPFYNTIELISRTFEPNIEYNITGSTNLYVYAFQTNFNSMDIRGKINLFGGASHSSDLPFLMGPSLFQSIARRRFTSAEDKISRNFRQYFGNFIKIGNPTPGRLYDAWSKYTTKQKYIKILGDSVSEENIDLYFERNLDKIDELLQQSAGSGTSITSFIAHQDIFNPYDLNKKNSIQTNGKSSNSYLQNIQDYQYHNHLKRINSFWNVLLPSIYKSEKLNLIGNPIRNGRENLKIAGDIESNRYRYAFFWMLGLVCFLLAILGVCIYILKQQNQSNWFVSDL